MGGQEASAKTSAREVSTGAVDATMSMARAFRSAGESTVGSVQTATQIDTFRRRIKQQRKVAGLLATEVSVTQKLTGTSL